MAEERSPARAIRPRFPPIAVQAGGVALSAFIGLASTKFPSLMPIAGIPAIGSVLYSYFAAQPRHAEIMLGGSRFWVFEKERTLKEGTVVAASLARYVQPGLHVTAGEVLVITIETHPKKLERILVATVERASAPATAPSEGTVDYFVGGDVFDTLRRGLPLERERSESSTLTVALAPHRGASEVLLGIVVPSFALFGFIGLALFATRLFPGENSEIVASIAVACSALGGIFFVARRFAKAPKEVLLRLDANRLLLGDVAGKPLFASPVEKLEMVREVYVFRTKYGSFRFPMLRLTDGERKLRIAVWQDRADLHEPGASEGGSPDYLANDRDFARLLARLG